MDVGSASEPKRRGYRVGAATRERLIAVATRLFAQHGYGATSTRQIAAAAGVTLPAITYHFVSKEGLHRACAEHVVEHYREAMGDRLGVIARDLPDMAPGAARDALDGVLSMLIGMLTQHAREESWLPFMLREMQDSGAAHAYLLEHLWRPGLMLVAALLAVARGHGSPAEEDRRRALLLLSSLSMFSIAGNVGLEVLESKTQDELAAFALAELPRLY